MVTGLRMLLTIGLLCVPQLAVAEALPDPTRPAVDLGGGESEVVPAAQRGVQTIIISPEYRAAIIDGETVHLGGKVGDARLVEIREGSVVLQNSRGRRVLELFPTVVVNKTEAPQEQGGMQEQSSGQPHLSGQEAGGSK